MSYSVIQDNKDHFLVHDGKGEPFKVAKGGLGAKLLAKIQKMHKGGAVCMDEGGAVPDAPAAIDAPAPSLGEPTTPYMAQWLSRVQPAQPSGPSATTADIPNQELGGISPNDLATNLGNPLPGAPIPMSLIQGSHDSPPQPTPAGQPAAAPPAPEAPAAPPKAAAGAPSGPGPADEIGAASKQAQKAVQQAADVASLEAKAQAEAQAAQNARMESLRSESKARFDAWQTRSDVLFNQIQNTTIDPQRFWNSRDAGQKAMASIGLILSGMGAGMTGQPNLAMEIINKNIDRDMEAQKLNLGKSQSLLNYHLQQGHTMIEAQEMAKADMKDVFAGQLAANAFKYADPKSQANAQVQIAQLRADAVQQRQAVVMHQMDNALKASELQMRDRQLAMGQMQMQAMGQLMGGGQQGAATGQPSMGARMDPRAFMFLPPDLQSRIVTLPDGSYATASTPEAKKEVDKATEGASTIRSKLARYSQLLDAHPHGFYGTDMTDKATAKALRDSILTDINGLSGLNRLTDQEVKLYSERLPDITDLQMSQGHQAKIRELGREIDDKVWTTNKQYLNLPVRKRSESTR